MPTSPINGLPSPDDNSPNDPPIDFAALNAVLDSRLVARFTNAAARDAAYASWVQAGNTMTDGLKCYTTGDDRYWTYRNGAWEYAGGAPPPIVLCTVQAGWTAFPGAAPAVFKDASGLIHLTGTVNNINQYNGSTAGDYLPILLPVGYRPASTTPPMQLAISGLLPITARIESSGNLRVISTANQLIEAAAGHLLSSLMPFHPGYTGGALA